MPWRAPATRALHGGAMRRAASCSPPSAPPTRRWMPSRHSVATAISTTTRPGACCAMLLHDVTVRDLWEALTILEPPLARAAARERSAQDLEQIVAAAAAFVAGRSDTGQAVRRSAQLFRCLGQATHNPVLGLAQEPLLQLLEPSLRVMIDKVPQARARIAAAHRRLLEALEARDEDGAQGWMARHLRDFRKGYEIAGIDLALRVGAG